MGTQHTYIVPLQDIPELMCRGDDELVPQLEEAFARLLRKPSFKIAVVAQYEYPSSYSVYQPQSIRALQEAAQDNFDSCRRLLRHLLFGAARSHIQTHTNISTKIRRLNADPVARGQVFSVIDPSLQLVDMLVEACPAALCSSNNRYSNWAVLMENMFVPPIKDTREELHNIDTSGVSFDSEQQAELGKYVKALAAARKSRKEILAALAAFDTHPYSTRLRNDMTAMLRIPCTRCRALLESASKCGGCQVVAYCSPECQRSDRAFHKKQCKSLRLIAGHSRSPAQEEEDMPE